MPARRNLPRLLIVLALFVAFATGYGLAYYRWRSWWAGHWADYHIYRGVVGPKSP